LSELIRSFNSWFIFLIFFFIISNISSLYTVLSILLLFHLFSQIKFLTGKLWILLFILSPVSFINLIFLSKESTRWQHILFDILFHNIYNFLVIFQFNFIYIYIYIYLVTPPQLTIILQLEINGGIDGTEIKMISKFCINYFHRFFPNMTMSVILLKIQFFT